MTNNAASPIGLPSSSRVSTYDQINAGLVTLILVGSAAFCLLLLMWWFSSQETTSTNSPRPVPPRPDRPADRSAIDSSLAVSETLKPERLQNTVQEIGTVVAQLVDKQGSDSGELPPTAVLDPRETGTHDSSGFTWSVSQSSEDLEHYQQQLDFWGIQIGVVHKTRNDIWRISHLSTEKTVIHSNRDAELHSHRFVNRNNRLRRWDQQIADQAGLEIDDWLLVHFYPPELIERMQQSLVDFCGPKLDEIEHVEFVITHIDDQYQLHVETVRYHNSTAVTDKTE